jgi:ATP-dependent Clp protease ATP-binding subunit ClpB
LSKDYKASENRLPHSSSFTSKKGRDKALQEARDKLVVLQMNKDQATRRGNDSKAADLQYYEIPSQVALIKTLEKEQAAANATEPSLGSTEVRITLY